MGFSAYRIADILLYVYRWLSFGFTYSMLDLDILHPLLLALVKKKRVCLLCWRWHYDGLCVEQINEKRTELLQNN